MRFEKLIDLYLDLYWYCIEDNDVTLIRDDHDGMIVYKCQKNGTEFQIDLKKCSFKDDAIFENSLYSIFVKNKTINLDILKEIDKDIKNKLKNIYLMKIACG